MIYDFVIMGSGIGGLSTAALLANKGKSVCVVEANKVLGGCSGTYTFKENNIGKYSFCPGVFYLAECEKGGVIYDLLQELDLLSKIKFNALVADAVDEVHFKDFKVGIPQGGPQNLEKKLIELYPQFTPQIKEYIKLGDIIFRESNIWLDKTFEGPLKYLFTMNLWRYKYLTLNDFFDKVKMPRQLRAILGAQTSIANRAPKDISLAVYNAYQFAYLHSAHYPEKGMKFFTDELIRKITSNKKSRVITSCRVKNIHCKNGKIDAIDTTKGEIRGKMFISNIDPQKTTNMLSPAEYAEKFNDNFKYDYSPSGFGIFLGLKGIDLKKLGFRRGNICYHSKLDIDEEFEDMLEKNNFSHPELFISPQSLFTAEGIMCPANHHTLVIYAVGDYTYFKRLYENDRKRYNSLKKQLYEHVIDIVEKNYVPNIRKYIDAKKICTAIDVEKILNAPEGNIYGCDLVPKFYNPFKKTTFKSPFPNLFFIGATATYPGVHAIIRGSLVLYKELMKK
jgi:phytoene dehydrogenase-like protein